MSKWTSDKSARVYEDGDLKFIVQTGRDSVRQAARIVKLLNEGEADRRRLDWLDLQVKCNGEWDAVHLWPNYQFTCANMGAKNSHANVREAIDAAIAAAPASKETAK